MQPFRTRVFNSAKVAATSLPLGARADAIDTRVSASQTLTINGGAQGRPRSYALRRDFPSTATTPRGAPRSKPSRIAPTKLASALASSAGSSRRNSRLKQSWLGAPCGKSTISASSAALTAPKSAMWTQLFWLHNVAASAMNRMADSSWRAFGARGSRTSRKIDNTGCIEGLPNQETPQNQLSSRWQQPLFANAIPLVAQEADAVDLDFDDITVLHPERRLTFAADPSGRARGNDVSGRKLRERG